MPQPGGAPALRAPEVITLLADAGLDVNGRNETGQTPLHIARTFNNLPAIRELLELGADPEAQDDADRFADPVCYWDGRGDPFRGCGFLARSPAESVRGCLESGIRVDRRHAEGATPLAWMVSALACCADFENVLREFVAAGADVDAQDHEGKTPLHRVFGMSAQLPASVLTVVTTALLDAGADPNARDLAGSTLLHSAAVRGLSPQVSLLVAAGANVDARNNPGRTPLHVARDPATIRTLLQLGADPAARDGAGTVADPVGCERWASQAFFAFATADIVGGCIAAGVEAHTIADGSQATALLFSAVAWTSDPAVVSMLLQAGADVDAWATGFSVDWGWGWTLLHLAARSNQDPEVVRALLEAGADLQAPGEESYFHGNSPIHYAGENPNPAVAAALLDAGADVSALSRNGRTPLHEAAANASNPAVIELLVAAGADVNALDSNGYAPMHSAAWYNPRPEIATALIAAGADVNARDPDGHVPPGRAANDRTPLFMALYRGGAFIGPSRRAEDAPATGGAAQPGVEGGERDIQRFRQCDVPGVVGVDVVTKRPCPTGERLEGEQPDLQIQQVLQCERPEVLRNLAPQNRAPQHVGHLHGHVMRSHERARSQLFGSPGSFAPAVDQGGCDDGRVYDQRHRRSASRYRRMDAAESLVPVNALRSRIRSSTSPTSGRSASSMSAALR